MKRLLAILAFIALSSLPSMAAWSKVQHNYVYCGNASTTSCSVPITQPGAGNLLVAISFNYNGATITTGSGAGTWVHPASCSTTVSGGQTIDMAYSLSASTGTSVTINFSTGVTFSDLWVLEFTGGVAPFSFDLCGLGSSTTSSVNGGSITTTGTNDLALAGVSSTANFTAPVAVTPSPWVSSVPSLQVNGGEAVDFALGFAATTTQAVFAGPAGNSAGVTIAFKDSTSAVASIVQRMMLLGAGKD